LVGVTKAGKTRRSYDLVADRYASTLTKWWDSEVDLTFRYLDPEVETRVLAQAGLELVARLDRGPYPAGEHASQRSYLIAQAPHDGDS
jgi:hypothetical protein